MNKSFEFINFLTLYENLEIHLAFKNVPLQNRNERIKEMLSRLGLTDKVDYLVIFLTREERKRAGSVLEASTEPAPLENISEY